MKKILIAIAFSLVASKSYAQGTGHLFYKKTLSEHWSVGGLIFDPDQAGWVKQPICVAQFDWNDGSRFEITKNLKLNTLYIWFRNLEWEIGDEPNSTFTWRINAFNGNTLVEGSGLGMTTTNKNTVYSQDIKQESFLKAFMQSDRLVFVPPGNLPNARVVYPKLAVPIVKALGDCIQSSKDPHFLDESKPDSNSAHVPNMDSPIATKKESL